MSGAEYALKDANYTHGQFPLSPSQSLFKQSSTAFLVITFVLFVAYSVVKFIKSRKTEFGSDVLSLLTLLSIANRRDTQIHPHCHTHNRNRSCSFLYNIHHPYRIGRILCDCSCIRVFDDDMRRLIGVRLPNEQFQDDMSDQILNCGVHDRCIHQHIHR